MHNSLTSLLLSQLKLSLTHNLGLIDPFQCSFWSDKVSVLILCCLLDHVTGWQVHHHSRPWWEGQSELSQISLQHPVLLLGTSAVSTPTSRKPRVSLLAALLQCINEGEALCWLCMLAVSARGRWYMSKILWEAISINQRRINDQIEFVHIKRWCDVEMFTAAGLIVIYRERNITFLIEQGPPTEPNTVRAAICRALTTVPWVPHSYSNRMNVSSLWQQYISLFNLDFLSFFNSEYW